MEQHKFPPGGRLHYKPSDFAPLQVRPGGPCRIVRLIESADGGCAYVVQLIQGGEELTVGEDELTPLSS